VSAYLYERPQVLALLREAKEHPEQDGPRLVLADYLEENGDPDRAEHVRLGCHIAPGAPPLEPSRRKEVEQRLQRLEERRGGAWLGSLWRWWLFAAEWHRGLLAVKLPRRFDPEGIADVLPWIDTLLLTVAGREGFQRVAAFLGRAQLNHLVLDLRTQMHADTLLGLLADLPASANLRTVTIHWPLRLLHRPGGEGSVSVPAVSDGFLGALLAAPFCRRLTHLGTSRPFLAEQTQLIRHLGTEPVHVESALWMHRLPPMAFRARSSGASPSRPLPVTQTDR
jgi:uncharacterized protein (TIGR02996 family)